MNISKNGKVLCFFLLNFKGFFWIANGFLNFYREGSCLCYFWIVFIIFHDIGRKNFFLNFLILNFTIPKI